MRIQTLEKRLEALEADAAAQEDETVLNVHFIGMDGIVTSVLEIRRDQPDVEREPTKEEIERSAEAWRKRLESHGRRIEQ